MKNRSADPFSRDRAFVFLIFKRGVLVLKRKEVMKTI